MVRSGKEWQGVARRGKKWHEAATSGKKWFESTFLLLGTAVKVKFQSIGSVCLANRKEMINGFNSPPFLSIKIFSKEFLD